jgi:hypothetical protein
MPAVSKKQERFMQAVANNPKFAKKAGVPQSVGREFTKKEGGTVNENKMMKKEGRGMAKADMQKVAGKAVKGHESRMHGVKKMAKGGGCEVKGKTKGTMIKMAAGGMPPTSNKGGAMRGLERAAAMSGRSFAGMGKPIAAKSGGMMKKGSRGC